MGTNPPFCNDVSQDQAHGSVNAVCERLSMTSAANALRLWGIPPWRGGEGPAAVLTGFRFLFPTSSHTYLPSPGCLSLLSVPQADQACSPHVLEQVQRGLTLRGTPREDNQPCC